MDFRDWLAATKPGDDALTAADEVNYAFLFANRALDTVKESLRIEHGLPITSDYIHALAHINLERLDQFGDILHEEHLKQSYPATPSLDEPLPDVNKAFAVAVEIFFRVDEALRKFVSATNMGPLSALARKTEGLQMDNSADRAGLLTIWQMWDDSRSKTSFDSWVGRVTGSAGNEVDDDD